MLISIKTSHRCRFLTKSLIVAVTLTLLYQQERIEEKYK